MGYVQTNNATIFKDLLNINVYPEFLESVCGSPLSVTI